jgi:hypothetical protein
MISAISGSVSTKDFSNICVGVSMLWYVGSRGTKKAALMFHVRVGHLKSLSSKWPVSLWYIEDSMLRCSPLDEQSYCGTSKNQYRSFVHGNRLTVYVRLCAPQREHMCARPWFRNGWGRFNCWGCLHKAVVEIEGSRGRVLIFFLAG